MKCRHRQAGAILTVDVLFGVIAAAVIFLLLYRTFDDMRQSRRDQVIASQMREFTTAAWRYVEANQAVFGSSDPAVNPLLTGPIAVFTDDLKADEHLHAGFSAQNILGQTHVLLLRLDFDGNIDAVTATVGGRPIEFARGPAIASMIGDGMGGFIPLNWGTVAQGAGGSWQSDLSPFAGAGVMPGEGSLVARHTTRFATELDPALYRVAIPGLPEMNRMSTDIDMGGHSITDAENVHLSSIGEDVTDAVYDVAIVGSGDLVDKPTCPAGKVPQVFANAVGYSDDGVGRPVIGVWANAEDVSPTQWRVRLRVSVQNDTGTGSTMVEPSFDYGRLMVITKCS